MGCFMELGAIEFANNNLNLSTDAFRESFVWLYVNNKDQTAGRSYHCSIS